MQRVRGFKFTLLRTILDAALPLVCCATAKIEIDIVASRIRARRLDNVQSGVQLAMSEDATKHTGRPSRTACADGSPGQRNTARRPAGQKAVDLVCYPAALVVAIYAAAIGDPPQASNTGTAGLQPTAARVVAPTARGVTSHSPFPHPVSLCPRTLLSRPCPCWAAGLHGARRVRSSRPPPVPPLLVAAPAALLVLLLPQPRTSRPAPRHRYCSFCLHTAAEALGARLLLCPPPSPLPL